MEQKKPKSASILYLFRDKFQMYSNFKPEILEFTFDQETVQNLEIIDQVRLENKIKEFIQENNIPAGNLVFLIGDNALYTKEFPTGDSSLEMQQNQIAAFRDKLPFDHVASITIPDTQNLQVYAANQDFFLILKEIFENHGFAIEFVMPAVIFEKSISSKSELTFELATIVFRDIFANEQYNLLNALQKTHASVFATQTKILEDYNRRIQRRKDILHLYAYTMLGLIVIAIAVIWNLQHQKPETHEGKAGEEQPTITIPALPTQPTGTITPTLTPVSSPSAALKPSTTFPR